MSLKRPAVYIIFAIEWLQTILITDDAFNKYALHYGDVNNLVKLRLAWFSVPVLGGIVSAAVQLYYARRIWLLSKSDILAGVIAVVSLAQGAAGIASGVLVKNRPASQASSQDKSLPAISAWLGGSALVDVMIAVAMTILLLRTRTGLKHSDTMVMKLVRLVIESGTLTATVAVVAVVLFAALPGTVYYEFPSLILAKLYANTLVTSLNNRAFLHKLRPGVNTLSGSDSAPSHSRVYNGGIASHHRHSRSMVRVDVLKETRVVADYELGEFPVGAISSFLEFFG
uniref:Carrier domain-containing protein n=1 Tax=Ganoderma boninense TaxID=34458 RepID=A0A5K1JYY7_9APHY|nr:Carrier domain-containing protein [Ganoderma boninense]